MNSWRISHRLLFLALLPAALLSLVLLVFFVASGMRAFEQEVRVRGQITVRGLAPASEYGVIAGHRGSLQTLAYAAQQQPDVRSIGIVDVDGKLLAQVGTPLNEDWQVGAGDGGGTAGEKVSEGRGWVGFTAGIRRTIVEFEDYPDTQTAVASDGERQIGFVYVEFSDDSLVARKLALIGNGLVILLAGLAVAAAVALRMSRSFSEPLQQLIGGVGAMGEGRLDARVPEDSVGELAVLERGFNEMARRLEDGHRTMQQRIDDATAQLAYQARHDALTGLVNRREFELRAERLLQSARGGVTHVLCYLDLDYFKIVNDTCGHVAGDELLRQLAHLLQQRIRAGDTLARLGGDEFGILLADCQPDEALTVAESLRQLVEDHRFSWQGRVFVVGASVGMVVIDAETKSLAELLSLADQACYGQGERSQPRPGLPARRP
jgi:diguanylate cyclase (GGDEF)-like protein